MIVVFARTFDDKLASLARNVDQLLQAHPEKKVGSYFHFLGPDLGTLKERAARFGEMNKLKKIPLVATNDFVANYNPLEIHPDAAATVIVYHLVPDRIVKANFAFRGGEMNARSIARITAEVKKQLAAEGL